MSTITAAAVTPVGGAFATTTPYSGTFIPTLWSAKLNAKFYAASTFADICNHNWEGEISGLGDKVIIQNIPDITINDYVVGGNLTYQVPGPSTIELQIDQAKSYGFAVHDVLNHQSKIGLLDMFTNDASEQLRTVMDSANLFAVFDGGAAANKGSGAGVKSGAFTLGTDASPVIINATTASTALQKVLELASVLDEQNVPDSGRWLVIPPYYRTILFQSNLAQAQFMGDATSAVRNGLIGTIDRFKVYVSNLLPTKATSATTWYSGDAKESVSGSSYSGGKSGIVLAGHTSAIAFASQLTKTETLRNPTDFGDVVRGLCVYGRKVTKDAALAKMIFAVA